jgi:hypothetical protein
MTLLIDTHEACQMLPASRSGILPQEARLTLGNLEPPPLALWESPEQMAPYP